MDGTFARTGLPSAIASANTGYDVTIGSQPGTAPRSAKTPLAHVRLSGQDRSGPTRLDSPEGSGSAATQF